ncbi:hypothetical protein D5086_014175 [Populus alba]|uniref:Uncharacterized protein n=1 Tax=Populus alba TaxID=43335 RepID=A0ACC4C7R0_POPAL
MSLPQSPTADSLHQQRSSTVDHRVSSKRKLDDVDDNDAVFSDLISVRMRKKDDTESSTGKQSRTTTTSLHLLHQSALHTCLRRLHLHLFIIHQLPLLRHGDHHTLAAAEVAIKTPILYQNDLRCNSCCDQRELERFCQITPRTDSRDDRNAGDRAEINLLSAPAALVALYVSSIKGNKECAEGAIRHFLNSCKISLPKNLHLQCVPIVMEFCNLLRKVGSDDPLYAVCRSCLGSLLENGGGTCGWRYHGGEEGKGVVMQEIFPFVSELGSKLFKDLMGSVVESMGPSEADDSSDLKNEMEKGAEEMFWTILRRRKASLCVLIVRYAKRTDDHQCFFSIRM